MCKVVGVTDKVRQTFVAFQYQCWLCVLTLRAVSALLWKPEDVIFFIPKVLVVQSMVNKETFVVKVSIPFSSMGIVVH